MLPHRHGEFVNMSQRETKRSHRLRLLEDISKNAMQKNQLSNCAAYDRNNFKYISVKDENDEAFRKTIFSYC